MSNSAAPRVSICVCTYNRCDYLREMLATLEQQALRSGDEVIVVDNNSKDSTAEVVASLTSRLPIRYCFEGNQGLSHARNRALAESQNDIVIFFDDDVFLRDGVVNAYRNGTLAFPDVGFMGGKITIAWPNNTVPNWWVSEDLGLLNGLLINYNLGDQDRLYHPDDRLPYGASFAVRRSTIRSVGEFDTSLGVSGSAIGRGEETDYFMRARRHGITGVYLGKATIQHRFEPHRLNVLYLFNYGIAKGRSEPSHPPVVRYWQTVNQIMRGVLQFVLGRRANFYQCMINAGIQWGRRA